MSHSILGKIYKSKEYQKNIDIMKYYLSHSTHKVLILEFGLSYDFIHRMSYAKRPRPFNIIRALKAINNMRLKYGSLEEIQKRHAHLAKLS